MASRQDKWFRLAVAALLCIGVYLRVNRYWQGFSFWGDEAWVACNMASRSFVDILLNRDLSVSLPSPAPGFVLIGNIMVTLWSISELVFRAFPCWCGVMVVFAFRKLLSDTVSRSVLLTGLAFMVFSDMPIYYASELKQYSSDMLVVLVIYVLHLRAVRGALQRRDVMLLELAGLAGMFISLPTILTLAGVSVVQLAVYWQSGERALFKKYLWIGGVWLAFFAGMWVNYYQVNYVSDVSRYYIPYYLYLPSQVGWGVWLGKILDIFRSPVGLTWPWLAALLFAAGGWSFWRRDKTTTLLLVAPLVLTIGLSMAGKYPWQGRFILFLLPALLVFIAQGVGWLLEAGGIRRLAGLLVLCILLAQPVAEAGRKYLVPVAETDVRSLMAYISEHYQPGDGIYLGNETCWSFDFYRVVFGLEALQPKAVLFEHPSSVDRPGQLFCIVNYASRHIASVYAWDRVVDSKGYVFRMPRGGRAWILLSQVVSNREKAFLDCFDTFGVRLDHKRSQGASLYLYNLK
ncbi:MAG: hypothetical protein HGA80_08525 [Candidatus Omnitrophica bacterium]|nr:hypothetical protein [Candidatus Omnitrophota bacterium]